MISIYEGFGLPLLEAMASGVPVLTSDRSCMPEVTAGAALLVNPDDVDAIRGQLARLIEDARWRVDATEYGLARARGLTWERCIEQTTKVYRSIA
jgi:alpha-1,3-rhamnosyl/mannosyltransferase